MRADHLLRVHHLLHRRGGLPPVPIGGSELEERLEALRRRNMGSRQRRREAARSSGNREAAVGPSDPAAEVPFCDQPPSSVQASAVSESPPHLLDLVDEDCGAAVVNMDEIEETLGLALTTTTSPSQPSESSRPELEILPNGIPVDDLAAFLKDKGDQSLTNQA